MDVFISYSTQDKDRVDLFKKLLNNAGYNTWMAPGSIPGSSSYIKEIPAAIRSSDVVVLFLSKKSQESFWVTAEIENAIIKNKPVFPFVIDELDLNSDFEFLLGQFQRTFAYGLSEKDAIAALDSEIQKKLSSMAPNSTHNFPTITYGKKIYLPNDYYEGEIVDGRPHGMGIHHYIDGCVYEGLWEKGVRKGRGKYKYITGEIYEGEWQDDKKSGHGKISFINGDAYSGEWKEDKMHGKGAYTFSNKEKYSGDFVDGKISGKGVYTFANGDEFAGDFIDGKQNGVGQYMFKDKNNDNEKTLLGKFVNYKMTGKGKCTFLNGDVFEGTFIAGEQDGDGKYTYKEDGRVLEGEFVNYKIVGIGKCTFPDDTVYEGYFVDNKLEGIGKLTFSDGAVYEGEFANDKAHGKGKIIFANGDVYDGDYADSKRNGEGMYTFAAEDEIWVGVWKDNEIIDGIRYNKKGKKIGKFVKGKKR